MKHWRHLEDGPAHYQPCPRCGAHTLTALSAGVKIRLDPETLTQIAELSALLAGKQTFDLMIWGLPRRMHPAWRDPSRIRSRRYQVVATHQCSGRSRPGPPLPETEITIPVPKPADNNQPQF